MSLASRLSETRQAKGLSRRALSIEAGLAQAVVGQIERGVVTNPASSTVSALAHALGVTTDWLISGDMPAEPEAAA